MEFNGNNFGRNRPTSNQGGLFPINNNPNGSRSNDLGIYISPNQFRSHLQQSANNISNNFTCPKCSVSLPQNQLDHHTRNCSYKMCNWCKQYFPGEFIQQHKS
jgi:hypothetical protein